MFCRKCGNEINDEDLFCAQCGATVSRPSGVDPRKDHAHESAPSSNDDPKATLDERDDGAVPPSTDQPGAEMLTCTAAKAKRSPSRRAPFITLAALVVVLAAGAAWASRPIDTGMNTDPTEAQQQEEPQDAATAEQEAPEAPAAEQPQAETENKQDSENEAPKEPAYGHETIELQVTMPIEPTTNPGTSTSSTWSYPRFTCAQSNEHIDRINNRYESEVQQQAANSETWTMDDMPNAQCLNLEYAVTYQEGPIVSVKEWRYETFWGGAWKPLRVRVDIRPLNRRTHQSWKHLRPQQAGNYRSCSRSRPLVHHEQPR